jgi:hypothetical protein
MEAAATTTSIIIQQHKKRMISSFLRDAKLVWKMKLLDAVCCLMAPMKFWFRSWTLLNSTHCHGLGGATDLSHKKNHQGSS